MRQMERWRVEARILKMVEILVVVGELFEHGALAVMEMRHDRIERSVAGQVSSGHRPPIRDRRHPRSVCATPPRPALVVGISDCTLSKNDTSSAQRQSPILNKASCRPAPAISW